jgi:hypothetical protein
VRVFNAAQPQFALDDALPRCYPLDPHQPHPVTAQVDTGPGLAAEASEFRLGQGTHKNPTFFAASRTVPGA